MTSAGKDPPGKQNNLIQKYLAFQKSDVNADRSDLSECTGCSESTLVRNCTKVRFVDQNSYELSKYKGKIVISEHILR